MVKTLDTSTLETAVEVLVKDCKENKKRQEAFKNLILGILLAVSGGIAGQGLIIQIDQAYPALTKWAYIAALSIFLIIILIIVKKDDDLEKYNKQNLKVLKEINVELHKRRNPPKK